MASATFLLPAGTRFGAQKLSAAGAQALGRADMAARGDEGRRAQLLRHVELPCGTWPIAAMSRQLDAGDASDAAWLRMEPAYLRPDINGVRLMAFGETLGLTQDDADALLPALRPVFGDAGFVLDAPTPQRWYVRLAREAKIPAFADPGEALGEDLFDHVDTSIAGQSPESRRWRALLSEVQVVLHNHPWAATRVARGQLPVNALWPWGGGTLPDDRIDSRTWHDVVYSDDTVARALATGAASVEPLPQRYPDGTGMRLIDLDALRDLARFDADWLQPALAALRRGDIAMLWIDCGDGRSFNIGRWHRLRFWRRPRSRFVEPAARDDGAA